jgi:hypothetical protein
MAAEPDASREEPVLLQHGNTGTGADADAQGFIPAPAAPTETGPEAEALNFSLPAEEFTPAQAQTLSQASYDWRAQTVAPALASSPPETLQMPDSWLALDNQVEGNGEKAPRAADMAPALSTTDDARQAHAAEVAGMLLAAESWMAEHNPLRAAEVLRPYVERDDMQSPAPGLYLLSLYRTMDDKGQIATVLAQLQRNFPAEAATWSSPDQWRRSMADYPAVHAVVDSLSDSDKLLPYLNSLLLAPEPFDFSTYRDIVRAIGMANEMKQESAMQAMSLDFE